MLDFPNVRPRYDELPVDPEERREALLDILGQHICWTRDLALARLRSRVGSHSAQEEPDVGSRAIFERIANQPEETQQLIFESATLAIHVFVKFLLGMLANIGTDLKQDDTHVIWYRLVAEIYDIPSGEIIEEMTLNRNQLDFLPDYLPKWLERTRRGL